MLPRTAQNHPKRQLRTGMAEQMSGLLCLVDYMCPQKGHLMVDVAKDFLQKPGCSPDWSGRLGCVEAESQGCAPAAWHVVIAQICTPVGSTIIHSLFWGAVFQFPAFYLSSASSPAFVPLLTQMVTNHRTSVCMPSHPQGSSQIFVAQIPAPDLPPARLWPVPSSQHPLLNGAADSTRLLPLLGVKPGCPWGLMHDKVRWCFCPVVVIHPLSCAGGRGCGL